MVKSVHYGTVHPLSKVPTLFLHIPASIEGAHQHIIEPILLCLSTEGHTLSSHLLDCKSLPNLYAPSPYQYPIPIPLH